MKPENGETYRTKIIITKSLLNSEKNGHNTIKLVVI